MKSKQLEIPTPQTEDSFIGTESALDKVREHLFQKKEKKANLLDMTYEQLHLFFQEMGETRFRAGQVFRWLYKQFKTEFSEMTNLSKSLRERLSEIAEITDLTLVTHQTSSDGTQKMLFGLEDGAQIESVLIPEGKRNTLCISSQVGCALGCRFCYTATMGAGRNLTVAEYMGQFIGVSKLLPEGELITNVVFMGMGEPLVNFDNLMSTLNLMTDENGIALGKRRITISTAGLCPQILELSEHMPVRLAISLHATTDTQRNELMPINQRYNLYTLFQTLQQFHARRRLPITLEYILIEGLNDQEADVKRLAKLARSISAKVNLIPYNEHPGAPEYKRPSKAHIDRFLKQLVAMNVRATRRATRGDDILAACGQLAIAEKKYD